ncbi:hypothetical protein J4453_03210 [Candidatus Woesearchaeota archaeon]|nr:hypothetical protein [Candidatus Woesearchaeota archaeon]
MEKPKVAISLDKGLLDEIDRKVDGSVIRSRSQAIEFFLRKGLQDQSITTAVLLLKGEHQSYALKKIKGQSLIKHQLAFFKKYGIQNVYVITQYTSSMNDLLSEIADASLNVEVIEKDVKGTAQALFSIKDKLQKSFLVMSGDTFNNFDLGGMVKKHFTLNKLATMGLMTREKPSGYGIAILDGDLIVDFQEKPKSFSTHIVNAGIYLFKPEVFELFEHSVSLEKDVFPKLAKIKQAAGYFTYGEYLHVSD